MLLPFLGFFMGSVGASDGIGSPGFPIVSGVVWQKWNCGLVLMETKARQNWTLAQAKELFALPFNDLMFQAQSIHRANFDPNQVQVSTLLSIKTGGCPEDCGYCSQSVRHNTGLKVEKLMDLDSVKAAAKQAADNGATRFCMGAAWRNPKGKQFDQVLEMIAEVKGLGMETCVTLGMLTKEQSERLKDVGLDYYNHNIDTSRDYYAEIISTRTFDDRLETLEHVRNAGLNVCCGGIVGMGEKQEDRIGMLVELACLPKHPESVPINMLVKVPGTPIGESAGLDPLEFVRTVAVARVMMPLSVVRLSAGREEMSEEMQALCFLAGANSIFYGDKLLTTPNPETSTDQKLFQKLGINQQGLGAGRLGLP